MKRLGSGGTGNVYLVHDRKRGHKVALKILRSDSPYSILRFKNEFRGLSELAHENLINLYEFHHEAHRWFFTMEYIEGVDFLDWVRPYNLLLGERETDLLRLRSAIEQLVRGLSTLHLTGHLHRDIKPSNVLVNRAGRLTILDFGLATRVESSEDRDVRGISGTLEYMAPEQTDGRQPKPAADWYSVGVLIYEGLTGHLPFEGKPLKIALDKRLQDGPNPKLRAPNAPKPLADLCEKLLRCEPSQRPDESSLMEVLGIEASASLSLSINALSNSSSDHLIGRERHLSVLVGAFMLHRQGGAHLIRLHGQSGMGKSSLLDAFLSPIKTQPDSLVLRGRCYQRESLTFRAFDQILDGLARHLSRAEPTFVEGLVPEGVSALATLFPVLQNVQAFTRKLSRRLPPTDPIELRKQAFRAVRSLIISLTEHRQVILCIDDAHHADLASFALLTELLKAPSPNIFVIVSYHTEAASAQFLNHLEKWLELEGNDIESESLKVDKLNIQDARELLQMRLGGLKIEQELFNQIVQESGGTPFFVELLASAVLKDGYADNTELEADDKERSVTLSSIFRRRLQQLPKTARRLLAIIAVSDEMLPIQVAWTAASVGQEGPRAIGTLQSELFVRTRRLEEVDYCEPYHERIRQAILAELNGKQIDRLNQDLSKAQAQHGEAHSQSLFDHFMAEGALDKARDFAIESGRRAAQHFAFERAVQLFEQALELHADSMTFPPSDDAKDTHFQVTTDLASAMADGGSGHQAARLYLEAARGAEGEIALQLQLKASNHFLSSGYIREGLKAAHLVAEALNLPVSVYGKLEPDSHPSDTAPIEIEVHSGVETEDLQSGFDALRHNVCWTLALTLSQLDDQRARSFHQLALKDAQAINDSYLLSKCLALDVVFNATHRTMAEAKILATAKQAYDLAVDSDEPHAIGLARYSAGVAHFLYGRWGLASHFLTEAVRVFREECRGSVWERSTAETFLIAALAAQGEFKDLIRRIPELLSDALDKGNRYLATNVRTGYATLVWLCADDPDSAIRHVDDAMTEWVAKHYSMQHYFALLSRIHVSLYQNNPQEALNWFAEDELALEKSGLRKRQFIDMELRILRIRALLAVLADPNSQMEKPPLRHLIRKELTGLFHSNSPWVIALAHYLKLIFDFHQKREELSRGQIDVAIQALEGTGLHHYARTASILKGLILDDAEGSRLIKEGLAEMRQRGAQNPQSMLRIYLPGVVI